MIVPLKLLSKKEGSFIATNGKNSGQTINYTTLIVEWEDSTISKLKASKEFDFTPYVGQNIHADVHVTVDNNMNPTLRCVGVVEEI